MNQSGEEPPVTMAHGVKTAAVGNLGESLTSVFGGQPQAENLSHILKVLRRICVEGADGCVAEWTRGLTQMPVLLVRRT